MPLRVRVMLLVVPGHPTRGQFPRLIATAVIAVVAFASSIGAETVASDIAVKSAFLFNFAKFTEWPAIPASTPIALCIFGDSKNRRRARRHGPRTEHQRASAQCLAAGR